MMHCENYKTNSRAMKKLRMTIALKAALTINKILGHGHKVNHSELIHSKIFHTELF
jgi:hypothetical protein